MFFRPTPNMIAAIAAIHAKRLSLRMAAIEYNVNYATLHRHSSGKYRFRGPPTELTADEEKEIAAWVIDVSKRGFPLTKDELMECVQLYLSKAGRTTKFKNNRPGRKWVDAFLKR